MKQLFTWPIYTDIMKNILVCTDFSKNAYCALHYATRLFRDEICNFVILHSYNDRLTNSSYLLINEMERENNLKVREEAMEKNMELLHSIKRDSTGNNQFKTVTTELPLVQAIKEQIEKQHIDLVVMGTEGKSGLSQRFFGRKTLSVIQHLSTTPILIIPRETDFSEPLSIDFATDFKMEPEIANFPILKAIVETYHSSIRFVHSGNEEDMETSQWKNYRLLKETLENPNAAIEYLPTHLEVSRAIAEHMKENHVDLLCMVKFKHQNWQFFREPVIKELDLHLRFPFLILQSEKMK